MKSKVGSLKRPTKNDKSLARWIKEKEDSNYYRIWNERGDITTDCTETKS